MFRRYTRIIRYLIAGGMTTFVNFALYTSLTRGAGWNENLSNVLAVFVSVAFAYVINKLYVFRKRSDNLTELVRECVSFFGARGLTIALDIGGLYLFHTVLGLNDLIVKVALMAVVVVLNYVISRFFIFIHAR